MEQAPEDSLQSPLAGKLTLVLEGSYPGFKELLGVDRLSGGASQETYRLEVLTDSGEKLLCLRRSPGGTIRGDSPVATAAPGLETEALLVRAARLEGIPEPEVYRVLEPGDGLGDGFIMEWLEGETLGSRIVRLPELASIRPKLAFQCGEILARTHQLDLDKHQLRDRLHYQSPEDFLHQTWDRYKKLDTPQPMIDYTGVWLEKNLPKDFPSTLVHNDFRNGNVMVSPEGIVAVLDWEIAHIGDPMRDLGWMCCNSWRFGKTELPVGGFGQREDLFAGYESVTGQRVDADHVKWWEVFGSFWWAIGTLGMAHHYRVGPDNSVERAAIGRRTSECQVDCVNLLIPGEVAVLEPEEFQLQPGSELDMPRLDEIVKSVSEFLRGDVMANTSGRTNFLARVSANLLDVAHRDLAVGSKHRTLERGRLETLLPARRGESLQSLKWTLVHQLREGKIDLDAPGLQDHLRSSVVNQIAIDQPRYSGFKTAIERH